MLDRTSKLLLALIAFGLWPMRQHTFYVLPWLRIGSCGISQATFRLLRAASVLIPAFAERPVTTFAETAATPRRKERATAPEAIPVTTAGPRAAVNRFERDRDAALFEQTFGE